MSLSFFMCSSAVFSSLIHRVLNWKGVSFLLLLNPSPVHPRSSCTSLVALLRITDEERKRLDFRLTATLHVRVKEFFAHLKAAMVWYG